MWLDISIALKIFEEREKKKLSKFIRTGTWDKPSLRCHLVCGIQEDQSDLGVLPHGNDFLLLRLPYEEYRFGGKTWFEPTEQMGSRDYFCLEVSIGIWFFQNLFTYRNEVSYSGSLLKALPLFSFVIILSSRISIF